VVLPDAGAVRTADDAMIDVGGTPLRLVLAGDAVWVSDIERGRLVRIDPGTGTVTRRTTLAPDGSEPEGLAFDGEAVWVVDQAHNRVLPVNPRSGEPGRPSDVGVGPRLVGTGPTGVWVANFVGGSVSGVATDGKVTDQPLESCLSPQGVVESAGVVWVTCTVEDRVVGLDATSLEVVSTFDGLDGADALAVDGDRVYAVGQAGPTVWTIDATQREVVGRLVLDEAGPTTENVGAAVTADGLAVTHPEVRRLYEVPTSLLVP
jgi:DNA-binding beta-propeller fold protein YncE